MDIDELQDAYDAGMVSHETLVRDRALQHALGVALPGEAGDVTVARATAFLAFLEGPVVTVAMERAKRG